MSAGTPEIDALEHAGKLAEARDLAIAQGQLVRASMIALAVDGPVRAEALARQAIAAADVAESWLALANVLLRKRDEAALVEAEQLLARADAAAQDPPTRAQLLLLRGLACARRGDARESLTSFDAGYRAADGHPVLRARILLAWALQLRNLSLFEDAARLAERSLELRLELGDRYGAAMCHGTLAFIAQRQGRHDAERDALVADLRLCEQLGTRADVPALKARLAGALLGLGKYAGAWTEAEEAIALETGSETRTHGFAWREQARVCLVRGAFADGLALAERARGVFERLGDAYGAALARVTEAELALAAGDRERARAAVDAARPVFVGFGALPELADTILVELACGADPDEAIVQRLLPVLVLGGLGHGGTFRRVKEALAERAPQVAFARAAEQAAMLRGLAAVAAYPRPCDGTVVAARVPALADARRFVTAAIDAGGVVALGARGEALAAFVGAQHAAAAQRCVAAVVGSGTAAASSSVASVAIPTALAAGLVAFEPLWPAGVRIAGDAADRALGALP